MIKELSASQQKLFFARVTAKNNYLPRLPETGKFGRIATNIRGGDPLIKVTNKADFMVKLDADTLGDWLDKINRE
jgi:hypothetical protein